MSAALMPQGSYPSPQGSPASVADPAARAQVAQIAERTAHAAEILMTLARKPEVSRRDLLKAAQGAVAKKIATAPEVVDMLATVPSDDTHLKEWVNEMAARNLVAAVKYGAQLRRMDMGITQTQDQGAPNASRLPMPATPPRPGAALTRGTQSGVLMPMRANDAPYGREDR